ncbi:MAG: type II secretion system F family protein [Nitrospirota bacterium]
MPYFSYRAGTSDGKIIEEKIEADDEESLKKELEDKGYLIFSIKMKGGLSNRITLSSIRGGIDPKEFIIFNQEFLALVKAGLPIIKTIDILIERAGDKGFNEALRGVRSDIKGGSSISDAMRKYPSYFPDIYISSLKAGERSGNLTVIMERYILYLKDMAAIRKKVVSALAYPSFLLIIAVSVIIFLLIFVMPTFSEIYKESKDQIPFATSVLLQIVDFLKTNISYFILVIIACIITLRYLYKTDKGKDFFDTIILKVPLIGDVVNRHNIIRIARTLSTVLSGGIPLVSSLDIVSEAITNRTISRDINWVRERIKEGMGLGKAFEKTGLMPKISVEMIEVGEATGSIEEMLNNIADFHEEELDARLNRITTYIEPMLLLIMGTIVAVIVIIMYLPIFHLAGTIR